MSLFRRDLRSTPQHSNSNQELSARSESRRSLEFNVHNSFDSGIPLTPTPPNSLEMPDHRLRV